MATVALAAIGSQVGLPALFVGKAGIGFGIASGVAGAKLGAYAGALIDSYWLLPKLFEPTSPDGPKVGDLSVGSAQEGAPIYAVYGTARVPGATIWQSELKHVENDQGGGTKGGQGGEFIVHQYYASVAVLFCGHPTQTISRIWADGKLFYDEAPDVDYSSSAIAATVDTVTYFSGNVSKRLVLTNTDGTVDLSLIKSGKDVVVSGFTLAADANNSANSPTGAWECVSSSRDGDDPDITEVILAYPNFEPTSGYGFVAKAAGLDTVAVNQELATYKASQVGDIRFYYGGEDQLPDKLIEQWEGSGVPGFRNRTYVVFDDLNLTDFGRRIPNFEALVVESEEPTRASVIERIVAEADLTGIDVDASAVTGTMRGYSRRGPQPPITTLQPILLAYDILGRYEGSTLTFFDRTAAPTVAIDPDDLAAHAVGESVDRPFRVVDDPDTEIPREVIVRAIDPFNEHQVGLRRAINPLGTTTEPDEVSLDLVLEPGEIQSLASKLLFARLGARQSLKASVPHTYLDRLREAVLVTIQEPQNLLGASEDLTQSPPWEQYLTLTQHTATKTTTPGPFGRGFYTELLDTQASPSFSVTMQDASGTVATSDLYNVASVFVVEPDTDAATEFEFTMRAAGQAGPFARFQWSGGVLSVHSDSGPATAGEIIAGVQTDPSWPEGTYRPYLSVRAPYTSVGEALPAGEPFWVYIQHEDSSQNKKVHAFGFTILQQEEPEPVEYGSSRLMGESWTVLLRRIDEGADGRLLIEGRTEDPDTLTQDEFADETSESEEVAGQGGSQDGPHGGGGALVWDLLSVPPLHEEHVDKVGLYLVATNADAETPWRGAVLHMSTDDGSTWGRVAEIQHEAVFVDLISETPGDDVEAEFVDRTNTWRVQLVDPETEWTPNTVDEEEMLRGRNRLAIGGEIMGWATATQVTGQPLQWDLSTLVRGLRGTSATAHGSTSERGVLLQTPGVHFVPVGPAHVGKTLRFRLASPGQPFAQAAEREVIFDGGTARPLAPSDVRERLSDSGSAYTLELRWDRRTRGITDEINADRTYLGQDEELYEVDVYKGTVSDANLVRTITVGRYALTTDLMGVERPNAALYTDAQRQADGTDGSGQVLNFRIYEVSSRVGRGAAASYSHTLPV